MDFIQPTSSLHDASVLFIKKKDGSLYLCVNFYSLNCYGTLWTLTFFFLFYLFFLILYFFSFEFLFLFRDDEEARDIAVT